MNEKIDNSLPNDIKNLNPNNENITQYFQPGIYAILNTTNQTIYIGQSQNIIRRLGFHLERFSTNKHETVNLQNDWLNKAMNFKFIILELGFQWSEEGRRKYFENRYFIEYRKTYNIYNNLNFKLETKLKEIEKEVIDSNLKPLSPINKDITYLLQPGLYCFENKTTGQKYVGETDNFIPRLFKHLSDFYQSNNLENMQKDWIENSFDIFQVFILEVGSSFSDKKVRRAVERQYFQLYKSNLYNSFTESQNDLKKAQPKEPTVILGDSQNKPVGSSIPVYYKNQRFNNATQASTTCKISVELLYKLLNDSNEKDWCYGRSYARFIYSSRTKLIVVNLNDIFLTAHLVGVKLNRHPSKIFEACQQNDSQSQFRFLQNLSQEEKALIPNLKSKIWKELRRTINLPLNLNHEIEAELFKEQSPTSPYSTDDNLRFSDVSDGDRRKLYNKLEERVNEKLNNDL